MTLMTAFIIGEWLTGDKSQGGRGLRQLKESEHPSEERESWDAQRWGRVSSIMCSPSLPHTQEEGADLPLSNKWKAEGRFSQNRKLKPQSQAQTFRIILQFKKKKKLRSRSALICSCHLETKPECTIR